MNLYTVRIRCVRPKVHCRAEVVADNSEQAAELVKEKMHRYVTQFLKLPTFSAVEMFDAVEIEVTEKPGPQVIKLDWDTYK
jgi:hypothetical protein